MPERAEGRSRTEVRIEHLGSGGQRPGGLSRLGALVLFVFGVLWALLGAWLVVGGLKGETYLDPFAVGLVILAIALVEMTTGILGIAHLYTLVVFTFRWRRAA